MRTCCDKLNVLAMPFNEIDLRNVDLNLLVVLGALMDARSVRGAAKALRLGPSAVSMALGRLRELFGDPMFVRGKAAMEPTPFAVEVFARVSPALAAVRAAIFERAEFDPSRAERVLRFASPDDLEIALLPRLLSIVRRRAPGIRLVVRPSNFRIVPAMLDAGEIDLALMAAPIASDTRHARERLYTDGLSVVFDPVRVGTRGPLGKKRFLEIPHVLQSASGVLRGWLDDQLAELGHRREVVAAVAHFSTLPFVLKRTRLLANMPTVAAHHYAKAFRLAVSPLPFPSPTFDIVLMWHAKSTQDPAIDWLRSIVRSLVVEVRRAARRHGMPRGGSAP